MSKNIEELKVNMQKIIQNFSLSDEQIFKLKSDNKMISESWKELRNDYSQANKDLTNVIATKKLIFKTYSGDSEEFKNFVKESKECKELDRCLILKNDLEYMINTRKFEETMVRILKDIIKDCEKSKSDLPKSKDFKFIKDFYIELKKAVQPADITKLEVENLALCSELIKLINKQYITVKY